MEALLEMACLGLEGATDSPSPNTDIPHSSDPLWLLGRRYTISQELEKIRRDVTSIIWLTYRKGFIPIGDEDGLTSDRGWGCMLRCGQMVLAQALVKVHMAASWIWTPETRDPIYLKILHKFEERKQSPYSIHQIALMGASEGKEVGQWFGPNTVAQVLKKLVVYDNWSSLSIHVALDNTVVKDDIRKLCTANHIDEWKPLLLIIPLRLGLNEINPIYVNGLKLCFQLPQSLGVIGGKPNQALYLIGCVGEEILYLDPHTTQKAGYIENKLTSDQRDIDATYHCKFASRIPILAMDPSVAVCFLCHTKSEFDDLCLNLESGVMKEGQPLFEMCEERPLHWGPNNGDLEQQLGAKALNDFDELDRQFDDSDEEFEIL
ncbi:autophagy-related 4a isoform X2 [Arctopsyche grandis]|uniref:autophagy-related 4a isoform X2 n=1 Tax=Arctopsyche grandis TaxID=121162 RepID=UPI00406D85AC